MRINKYIAQATSMSRRAADEAISAGRVIVNGEPAAPGTQVKSDDHVSLDGRPLGLKAKHTTVILNKPVGYVCSRNGQGSPTVYDLLPPELQRLKTVGRLDKDSSGLLLLTDDGDLANQLAHPRHQKEKIYEVVLNKAIHPADRTAIEQGTELEDGLSRLRLGGTGNTLTVTMSEGRNRQIRRTFAALGYSVTSLHRIQFGDYQLDNLQLGTSKFA